MKELRASLDRLVTETLADLDTKLLRGGMGMEARHAAVQKASTALEAIRGISVNLTPCYPPMPHQPVYGPSGPVVFRQQQPMGNMGEYPVNPSMPHQPVYGPSGPVVFRQQQPMGNMGEYPVNPSMYQEPQQYRPDPRDSTYWEALTMGAANRYKAAGDIATLGDIEEVRNLPLVYLIRITSNGGTVAHELVKLGVRFSRFEVLGISDADTNTVAHLMAREGYNFEDLKILSLADSSGWTVAHTMAAAGHTFTDPTVLEWLDDSGMSVKAVIQDHAG